jgi:hypothetical protein
MKICKVSTLGQPAKIAVQHLQVWVHKHGKNVATSRLFSAIYRGKIILVPLKDGSVLNITKDETSISRNGDAGIWLEHPEPGGELTYMPNVELKTALDCFEKLCVDTQACQDSLKWLVAMHEGLFPYIRDFCVARPILAHVGPTQQGKTSGAQRFTMLNGLGQVKGDYSVAALGNAGDLGLLVMDNKEQANFTQPLTDFCLFLATGAERGRSTQEGKKRNYSYRPVGVITSIEGVPKAELKARVIEIEYRIKKGQSQARSEIEKKIFERSDEIRSALIRVLSKYLEIRQEINITANPIPNFEEWFGEICRLLYAYCNVAAKPEGWAESIIQEWISFLKKPEEPKSDELEHHIESLFDGNLFSSYDITYSGQVGKLYRINVSELLSELQRRKVESVPKDKNGFARRLRSACFEGFTFLDEKSGLEPLKRKTFKRWIGFFVPNYELSKNPSQTGENDRDGQ